MSYLREYREFDGESWAYKQGWLWYERDCYNEKNPHEVGTNEYEDFERGWGDAQFAAKVEGGYFDWY